MPGRTGIISYKFKAAGQKVAGYEVNKSLATDIDKAELFAFASNRSILLYMWWVKLCMLMITKEGTRRSIPLDLPTRSRWLNLMFSRDMEIITILYVATYNSTTRGTLQKYVLGTDQNTFELKPDEKCKWNGLVKVKDIDWKNSVQ